MPFFLVGYRPIPLIDVQQNLTRNDIFFCQFILILKKNALKNFRMSSFFLFKMISLRWIVCSSETTYPENKARVNLNFCVCVCVTRLIWQSTFISYSLSYSS